MNETRVSAAFAKILTTAADLANDEYTRREGETRVSGSVFAPWPDGMRLALHVSPLVEITDEHREIARDAVKAAIYEHHELFVGVILGCARLGINLFDVS